MFSQVVIIDELSINEDDTKKMKAGTSELEETLAWLADNTAMTLAALSSTDLLDRATDAAAVSQKKLDEMIARTGFVEAVHLEFIMRSSQHIAAATSPASVNQAQTGTYNIQESISPGSSSTVPGTRPRAWVYKHTDETDYNKLAEFVTQHLRTVDTERLKCVVLTGWGISAQILCSKMNTPASFYDGGVEMFYNDDSPKYREDRASDGGEEELTAWLRAEAGVLVTHEMQFRGAECDSVIFVTKYWAGYSTSTSSRRSPVTRAVAGLLVITGDRWLSVQNMRRDWDVEILEKGVSERYKV